MIKPHHLTMQGVLVWIILNCYLFAKESNSGLHLQWRNEFHIWHGNKSTPFRLWFMCQLLSCNKWEGREDASKDGYAAIKWICSYKMDWLLWDEFLCCCEMNLLLWDGFVCWYEMDIFVAMRWIYLLLWDGFICSYEIDGFIAMRWIYCPELFLFLQDEYGVGRW